jgi:hypothetical protein
MENERENNKKLFVVRIENRQKNLFTIYTKRKNYIMPILLEKKNGS